jgi:hypothetical protein
MKRIFAALVTLAILTACHCPVSDSHAGMGVRMTESAVFTPTWNAPDRPDAEKQIIAPFEALNRDFRETYARARAAELAKYDTVILQRFDGLTLYRKGKIIETKRVVPATYHDLRYFSHVAFNIYLKLSTHTGKPLDSATIADLENFRTMIKKATPDASKLSLTIEQVRRQYQISTDSERFLTHVIASKQVTRPELREFATAETRLIHPNLREAAVAQVDGLHAQMLAWKKQFPDADWKNFKVIVHGGQQPRCDHVATQYFAALFKEPGDGRGYPGESRRVIYLEDNGPAKEYPWDPHMNLLAAINLDADAAEAFFGDPDRLAVEAMADGARAYLKNFNFGELQK